MSTILLPKTQHLVVFQEVIRSGSIGSAAKELGLTQPAVSKIINDIEDYFGVELVVRKNTGVTLTPAGQLLLSRSESITREMKNMVNEISGMSSEAVVEVSFGFPSLIGFTFMSGMINKFKEVFPKAQVSMYEAQLSSFLPAIRDDGFQLAQHLFIAKIFGGASRFFRHHGLHWLALFGRFFTHHHLPVKTTRQANLSAKRAVGNRQPA